MCMCVCVCLCSVREWIQCMQVCCHSRTTHSVSPPAPSVVPAVASSVTAAPTSLHHHHLQIHPQVGLGPMANPTTFSYHLAPSTLAYLPLTSDLAKSSSGVASDTGYVSGEPSPTEHPHMVSITLWAML